MRKKIILTVSISIMMLAAFILKYFWMPYYGSAEWTLSYGIARYSFYLIAPLPFLFFFVSGFGGYEGDVWPLWGISLGLRAVCDAACMGLMAWLGDGLVCIPYVFDCLHIFACGYAVQRILVLDKALLKEALKKRLPVLMGLLIGVVVFIYFVQAWISGRIINVFVAGSKKYEEALNNANLMVYLGSCVVLLISTLISLIVYKETVPISETIGRISIGWLSLLPMLFLITFCLKGMIYIEHSMMKARSGSTIGSLESYFDMDWMNWESEFSAKRKSAYGRRSVSGELVDDPFYHKLTIVSEEQEKKITYYLMTPAKKEHFRIGDTDVGILTPYCILFTEEDKSTFYEVDKLSAAEENGTLTQILRYQVAKPNFLLFPHAAAYLIRYEPQFITPYLERYANGDFTEEELERLGDIRPEYIRTEARRLLRK